MPRAVCSVLRGEKLHREGGVTLLRQEGPADGMNVLFHFSMAALERGPPKMSPNPQSSLPNRSLDVDLSGALLLISCTKTKLSVPAPARELYCSPAFQMKRRMAERLGNRWLILSAKHGLVEPEQIIAPYDETLTSMSVSHRRAWATNVMPPLLPIAHRAGHVAFLAGQRYVEFLIAPLVAGDVQVSEPLKGLRQGEQLSWLTKHL